ncbi:MAG: DNA repair protein RadC, partial [Dehalococcoidia bacterium]|nr:DNA repair protein RadC [Dehalococcoidia bacterium]
AYSSVIRPDEVLLPAVLEGVPNIIIADNHPSADPSPSPQDIKVTGELREAAELLGLSLLDHVVIGGDEAVSFKDRGLLD